MGASRSRWKLHLGGRAMWLCPTPPPNWLKRSWVGRPNTPWMTCAGTLGTGNLKIQKDSSTSRSIWPIRLEWFWIAGNVIPDKWKFEGFLWHFRPNFFFFLVRDHTIWPWIHNSKKNPIANASNCSIFGRFLA